MLRVGVPADITTDGRSVRIGNDGIVRTLDGKRSRPQYAVLPPGVAVKGHVIAQGTLANLRLWKVGGTLRFLAREARTQRRRERVPRRNDMKRWLDGWRGVGLLFAVALVVYWIEALAWPLQRGRDSWDYWLYYLQLADRHPVFWAVQVFRTPVTPLVTGIPMTIGGARLLEAVMGVIYAAGIVGWAWAARPFGRVAAIATAVVALALLPYAAMFHEVSSDFLFGALLAPWAGLVVRAIRGTPDLARARRARAADRSPDADTARRTGARPGRLCRRPDRARNRPSAAGLTRRRRGGGNRPAPALGEPERDPLRRLHRRPRRQGLGPVLQGAEPEDDRSRERAGFAPSGCGDRPRRADPAAVPPSARRSQYVLAQPVESRGDQADRALGSRLRPGEATTACCSIPRGRRSGTSHGRTSTRWHEPSSTFSGSASRSSRSSDSRLRRPAHAC